MNSRQRRGIILLILSVLCALGAFAGVLSVINDVKSKVGPEVTAYRVKSDIEPYTELGATQFEKVEMPERWLSENAVTDLSRVRGKIAVTTLKAGSLLQTDMIVDTPALRPGQQEVAIMIDAATGVAGKITPGSTVNVYATFEGPREGDPDQSKIIVTGAKVIDVGELTSLEPDEDSRDREPTDAVPITFALSTIDAQRITYAESFARR
ncbi:Flp pilus assembly protein CpaB, partial [Streptomyces violaceoruber]